MMEEIDKKEQEELQIWRDNIILGLLKLKAGSRRGIVKYTPRDKERALQQTKRYKVGTYLGSGQFSLEEINENGEPVGYQQRVDIFKCEPNQIEIIESTPESPLTKAA